MKNKVHVYEDPNFEENNTGKPKVLDDNHVSDKELKELTYPDAIIPHETSVADDVLDVFDLEENANLDLHDERNNALKEEEKYAEEEQKKLDKLLGKSNEITNTIERK